MPHRKEARVQREDCWDLVIHYYPRAALNDVKPHIFHFGNPPTKEEFLAVCAELPWTHIWDNNLLLLIRKSKKWPKIRVGFKSNSITLKTKYGEVATIVIERTTVWKNRGATPQ